MALFPLKKGRFRWSFEYVLMAGRSMWS